MKNIKKSKFFCIYFLKLLLFCRLLNAQDTVNISNVKVVKRTLHMPPLTEIQTVFQEALLQNYAEAKVEIVDPPDLTEYPFNLASPGLGGSKILVDVGGLSRYTSQIQQQPLYDLQDIAKYLNLTNEIAVFGAANGPWPHLQEECDLAANIILNKPTSVARSIYLTLNKTEGRILCQSLPLDETRFAVQGNFFLSEGKREKVIKVFAKKRIGAFSFSATLRKSIENYYGDTKLVGFAGAFVLHKGKARTLFANSDQVPVPHGSKLKIMRKYSYLAEVHAIETAVGTFVSAQTELDLIGNHFHAFSQQKDGGHFVQDITPEIVEYEGYFTPAKVLFKIDQAPPLTVELISKNY